MSVVLLASYAHVGEYLILDGATRNIVFGPFESNTTIVISATQCLKQGADIGFVPACCGLPESATNSGLPQPA